MMLYSDEASVVSHRNVLMVNWGMNSIYMQPAGEEARNWKQISACKMLSYILKERRQSLLGVISSVVETSIRNSPVKFYLILQLEPGYRETAELDFELCCEFLLELDHFWGVKGVQEEHRKEASGRSIDLGFPPIDELLPKLVAMLSHLPGVEGDYVWKTGVRFSITKLPAFVSETIPKVQPHDYRHCMVGTRNRPQRASFLLDTVLPMSMRAKILRDFAKGIDYLHSQKPPFLLPVTFLKKVTFLSHHWMNQKPDLAPRVVPLATIQKKKISPGTTVPHRPFPSLPDKKGASVDLWNFGMLVHNVVNPGASLNYKHQPIELLTQNSNRKATTTTGIAIPHTAAPLLTTMGPQQREYKCTAEPTSRPHTPLMPDWAMQVITCCWCKDDPPSFSQLLTIWNWFRDPVDPSFDWNVNFPPTSLSSHK
ncbi:hypothetical protein Pelo_7383 [Pelomyxa schiedti]|nr:hypothetical protein Pelo_7383 [Pelomyxa schiedti]